MTRVAMSTSAVAVTLCWSPSPSSSTSSTTSPSASALASSRFLLRSDGESTDIPPGEGRPGKLLQSASSFSPSSSPSPCSPPCLASSRRRVGPERFGPAGESGSGRRRPGWSPPTSALRASSMPSCAAGTRKSGSSPSAGASDSRLLNRILGGSLGCSSSSSTGVMRPPRSAGRRCRRRSDPWSIIAATAPGELSVDTGVSGLVLAFGVARVATD